MDPRRNTVTHFYNPSYGAGRVQEDAVQRQPGPKVSETLSQQISHGWCFTPVITPMQETVSRRTMLGVACGAKMRPYVKRNSSERAASAAQ
jgi:hypothetical protein